MLTYLPDSHFLGASGGHARFHSLVLKHGDGNVNEASVSLQAGNERLRLVATIAAYLAAIVGLCGRFPNCPRLNATTRLIVATKNVQTPDPLPMGEGVIQFTLPRPQRGRGWPQAG